MPCEKNSAVPLLQTAPHVELFLHNLKKARVSMAQLRLLFCSQRILRPKNTSSGSGEVCALHVGFYSLRYDFRVLFHLCTSDQTKYMTKQEQLRFMLNKD